jgi:hypothetical protein
MYSETGLSILLGGEGDEVADTAGVAPLVVIPGDELDEGVRELDAGLGVEDRRVGVTDEVGGDNSLVGVLDDALVRALSGSLDGSGDLLVLGGLLEADNEIDDRDVEGGDTESETTVGEGQLGKVNRWSEYTHVSLPLREGITLPTALAAPVEEGMMLLLTERPPRQSLEEGPSTVFWVAVAAWTVVMRPSAIPKLSLIILAKGARQLVVQEAFEI